jgi:uncharacterized protein DUF4388
LAEDAFPVSGTIDPKVFPFLLMDLNRQGATGSLKVDGPTYQKALYFRGGRVLFGSSNDPKDQLGSILIESGRVTPEQIEDVNTKVGPGNPLAKVLAESGFVSQRELSEAARAKVERILSDVLSYDTGSFDFEDGVLPKGAVDLKLAPDKLVLAAVRRIPDRAFVLRHIGGLDAVLSPTADASTRLHDLQAETSRLPEFLDGNRNLKDVAAAARLDEFEAAKVACGLMFLGLVERPAGQAPAAESGFAIVGDEEDLDLSQTARMAFVPEIGMGAPEEPKSPPAAELAFDPDRFAQPATPTLRSAPPDTVFIEPPMTAARPPEPPPPPEPTVSPEAPTLVAPPLVAPPAARRKVPSDTNPPSRPAADIRLPSLGDTGFEAAGAETLPKSKPPSRDDLAALDALLHSRSLEGPLTPLQKPQDPRWEPRFGHQPARPIRGRRAGGGMGRTLAIGLGLLLLVGALGAVGWFQFFRERPTPQRVAGPVRPSPVSTTTLPATLPTTLPAAADSTPAPAASTGAAVPATTLPRSASPMPAPAATPAATPAPPAARETSGGSLADARNAFQRGEFPRAARDFASSLRKSGPGSYSVQLLVACSEETLQKAVQSVAAHELFILPVDYRGRSCYRVCWGIYESEALARSATREIPDYFRKGGASPKPVATAAILP